jgi:diguanylate cyclase (GGDEF)-like protein
MARKTLGKRRFFTRRPTKDSLKIDHAHETTPPVPHAMNTASPDREKPLHTATRMLASAWAGLTSAIARLDGRPTGTAVLSRPRPLHLRELEPQVTARRRTDASEPLSFPGHANTPGEAITLPPLALKTHQDTLTGLASREYLNDNAEGLVAALRAGGTEACILRIGVDGLDAVTQRYGAHAADQVLQQVAKRLRHLARERDIVMRLHGAEFALLVACPGQESAAFARTLANRVLADLKRPFSWRTLSNLRICGCVGSAVWPANGATLDEVMAYAEDALASARRSGPGQTRQFVEGFSNRFDPTAHPAAA